MSRSLHGAKDDGMADEPHPLVLLYLVPARNFADDSEEKVWVGGEKKLISLRGGASDDARE